MAQALQDPERVLVVTAHPDDVDFMAGGTVAALSASGTEVAYVVATDGQTGGFDPTVPRERMGVLRQAEQRAAAAVLGVDDVTFLGLVDSEVEITLDLRRAIAREIRRFRPDVVLTTSPERDWDRVAGPGHPDHLAVGEAAIRAVYPDARNPFAFPELLSDEGLEPHTVTQVWFSTWKDADHVVDVSATVDAKIAAIRCHATQLPDPTAIEQRIRQRLLDWGAAAGLPAGASAECFRVVPTG